MPSQETLRAVFELYGLQQFDDATRLSLKLSDETWYAEGLLLQITTSLYDYAERLGVNNKMAPVLLADTSKSLNSAIYCIVEKDELAVSALTEAED